MEIKCIYSDSTLRVLFKPACIHTNENKKNPDGESIEAYLRCTLGNQQTDLSKAEDFGLVNRLDFETSGLLLVANTKTTWQALRDLQRNLQIEKRYLAIVEGRFVGSREVTNYHGQRYRGSKKVSIFDSKEDCGMRGCTKIESVFKPICLGEHDNVSLIRIDIHLGKRHQIRAQAAHLGHALVGDDVYGSRQELNSLSSFGLDSEGELPKFVLHNYEVVFPSLESGEMIKCRSTWPEYLTALSAREF